MGQSPRRLAPLASGCEATPLLNKVRTGGAYPAVDDRRSNLNPRSVSTASCCPLTGEEWFHSWTQTVHDPARLSTLLVLQRFVCQDRQNPGTSIQTRILPVMVKKRKLRVASLSSLRQIGGLGRQVRSD